MKDRKYLRIGGNLRELNDEEYEEAREENPHEARMELSDNTTITVLSKVPWPTSVVPEFIRYGEPRTFPRRKRFSLGILREIWNNWMTYIRHLLREGSIWGPYD